MDKIAATQIDCIEGLGNNVLWSHRQTILDSLYFSGNGLIMRDIALLIFVINIIHIQLQ